MDSKPVQDSLHLSASLTLTHPHLGVKVDPEFSKQAGELWAQIRKEAKISSE